jgi:hypothetical protein
MGKLPILAHTTPAFGLSGRYAYLQTCLIHKTNPATSTTITATTIKANPLITDRAWPAFTEAIFTVSLLLCWAEHTRKW